MWRASVWAALWLAAAAAAVEPRCRLPGCAPGYSKMHFSVEGSVITSNFVGDELTVNCNKARILDSPALPAYEPAVVASLATFARCPPPDRPLAAVLRALNVTLAFAETLGNLSLKSLPPRPTLEAYHFLGLERLVSLKLTAESGQPPPTPAPGFLAELRALRSLKISGVRLAAIELDSPPRTLRVLYLRNVSWAHLPAALVALPSLITLDLNEQQITNILIPPNLRTLSMKYTESSMNDIPTLEDLTLDRWQYRRPLPFRRCDALRALTLLAPTADALPQRWVAHCPRLKRLIVKYARNLKELPDALLEGATSLFQLTIRQGELGTLPSGLLDHVPNLRVLDLENNRLHTLPNGMFAGPRALAELNLASNLLSGEALHELAGLRDLAELNLANNLRIADVCDENGYSPLINQTKLTALMLVGTGVTRICRDWRSELSLLENLNLSRTNISNLTFSDIQFSRAIPSAEVWLTGVRFINFTADDYAAALKAPSNGAALYLDSTFACDCHMYWMGLAMKNVPLTLRVKGLRCRTKLAARALQNTAPEDMYCEAENACRAAELPAACECWRRPRDGGGHVVRVDCARRNRSSVPPLRAQPATVYRLLLAGNNISELRADHLSPPLQELDLSENFLEAVDEETADALESHPSLLRLRLAGNLLACDCRAAPLLRAMRGHFAADLHGLACSNGTALAALATEHCAAHPPPDAWFVVPLVALAMLMTVASAIAACLASRDCRLRLRVLLYRWGVLKPPVEPDDARYFDAFVSFSHEDEEVVRALVTRLEAGPVPHRLCLHYRDWVPGRWIPDLIQASVNQSRRTLALVSRHFLESEWARAEFREAYAHALRDVTPRLVVVLLEDPAALPLDSELRRYLSANTYVRWGDPWFWDKLALALPAPRPTPRALVATVAEKVPGPPLAGAVNLSGSQRTISEPPTE